MINNLPDLRWPPFQGAVHYRALGSHHAILIRSIVRREDFQSVTKGWRFVSNCVSGALFKARSIAQTHIPQHNIHSNAHTIIPRKSFPARNRGSMIMRCHYQEIADLCTAVKLNLKLNMSFVSRLITSPRCRLGNGCGLTSFYARIDDVSQFDQVVWSRVNK